ncbi:TPA: hypothetical protein ACSQRH_000352 [Clostridium perfringens]
MNNKYELSIPELGLKYILYYCSTNCIASTTSSYFKFKYILC